MAVAPEVTNSYGQTPARQSVTGQGGHKDVALRLVPDGTVISITTTTDPVAVEGMQFAEWVIEVTAITGTNPTLDCVFYASRDGGSNFTARGIIRQLVSTDVYSAATAVTEGQAPKGVFGVPVWIPRGLTTNKTVPCRVIATLGGTASPSFTINMYLRDFGYGLDQALNWT